MGSSMFMMWLNLMPWPFLKVVVWKFDLRFSQVHIRVIHLIFKNTSILNNVANEIF